MDKRYGVFVSSTYSDLKDERREVIQALMEMDCIPAGMELFPAADEEQFAFIKRVIDDCDYYIVIIGGRYGSVTSEGISYTEKEYDYARERKMPVLAFVHDSPDDLAVKKSDIDPTLRSKLDAFRSKVKTGAIVKMWHEARELPGMVALSLTKTIKAHPAVGWVRANQVASSDLLADLNELRKQNEALRKSLSVLTPSVSDLAGLDATFEISGTRRDNAYENKRPWKLIPTWKVFFAAFAPRLMGEPHDILAKSLFDKTVREFYTQQIGNPAAYWEVDDRCFQLAKVQLSALKLVNVEMLNTNKGGTALFWKLTPIGSKTLLEIATQKAGPQ